MTRKEILEKLTPIFQEVFNDNEMEVNLELTSDDIDEWSSVSQALLITEIEQKFAIRFKLLEVAKMDNVGTIVSIIEEKIV
ncbi:MAG: acyl carrier protein [Bacteroidaceae bacterium]|nr:acyl carrier protein [Bacteroidaceae bacterium]